VEIAKRIHKPNGRARRSRGRGEETPTIPIAERARSDPRFTIMSIRNKKPIDIYIVAIRGPIDCGSTGSKGAMDGSATCVDESLKVMHRTSHRQTVGRAKRATCHPQRDMIRRRGA